MKTFGRYTFRNYMDRQLSKRMLAEAASSVPILGPDGRPWQGDLAGTRRQVLNPDVTRSKGKVVIDGFQGFAQHNPLIQAFARLSPENWAQTVLFGPMTANVPFSKFNEWFPVLMQFLRRHDRVTREQVVAFISAMGSNTAGRNPAIEMPDSMRGGDLAGVVDLGRGNKSALVVDVWNNREKYMQMSDEMASEAQWDKLIKFFAGLPGVQVVKAGFIVQLLYGQMGCIDIHNVRMYKHLAKELMRDPETPPERREAWKKVYRDILQAQNLTPDTDDGDRGNSPWVAKSKDSAELDAVVKPYTELLKHMRDSLGINSRVLWDWWCNYVAYRYERDTKNRYSRQQGLIYQPNDQEMLDIMGGKEREIPLPLTDRKATLLTPHITSGAISRVHMVAAIDPTTLVDMMKADIGGGMQGYQDQISIINSSLRSDPNSKPALMELSDRILDAEKYKAIMTLGQDVMQARSNYLAVNSAKFEQLVQRAGEVLVAYIQTRYRTTPEIAQRTVEVYKSKLKEAYTFHMRKILQSLRGAGTRDAKAIPPGQPGAYIGNDDQFGYGVDRYDPDTVFAGDKSSRITDRFSGLGDQAFGYASAETLMQAGKEGKRLKTSIDKLTRDVEGLKGKIQTTTTRLGEMNAKFQGALDRIAKNPDAQGQRTPDEIDALIDAAKGDKQRQANLRAWKRDLKDMEGGGKVSLQDRMSNADREIKELEYEVEQMNTRLAELQAELHEVLRQNPGLKSYMRNIVTMMEKLKANLSAAESELAKAPELLAVQAAKAKVKKQAQDTFHTDRPKGTFDHDSEDDDALLSGEDDDWDDRKAG